MLREMCLALAAGFFRSYAISVPVSCLLDLPVDLAPTRNGSRWLSTVVAAIPGITRRHHHHT